jgi:hypothetical protein
MEAIAPILSPGYGAEDFTLSSRRDLLLWSFVESAFGIFSCTCYHVTVVKKKEMVVKVAISGAAGRMGRRLMSMAVADPDVELVQALEYAAHPLMGKVLISLQWFACCAFWFFLIFHQFQKVSEIEPEAASDIVLTSTLESGVDVVIDFSSPQGTLAIAKRAEELGVALVIGTTAKVIA